MALLELTVQPTPDVTRFVTSIVLDGARYHFSFYTDRITDGWAFDVTNDDGSSAVRGLALAVGVDLLYPYRYRDLPPGILFVHDIAGAGVDPDVDAFANGRAALYYLEAEG